MEQNLDKYKHIKIIEFVAQITGVIAIAFFLSFILFSDGLTSGYFYVLIPESIMLGVSLLGYLILWAIRKKNRIKGLLIAGVNLIIASIGTGVYHLIGLQRNKNIIAMVYSLPLLIPGILFLICYYIRKMEN
jgi:hypothetical protein